MAGSARSSARISVAQLGGDALVGVERKNPVVGREGCGVILLIDVAVPRAHVDAIGELPRDRDRVVRALGVDDDDLVGPGEGLQRVGDRVGFVLRDDRGGDGRHCSGIVYYAVDMEQNEALDVVSAGGRLSRRAFPPVVGAAQHRAICSRRSCCSTRPMPRRSVGGIAAHVKSFGPTVVLSPALGGLIIGHEVARALGVRAIFAERSGGAALSCGAGFSLRRRSRARRRRRVHDRQVDARDHGRGARRPARTSWAPRRSSIAAAERSISACRRYALVQLSRADLRSRDSARCARRECRW